MRDKERPGGGGLHDEKNPAVPYLELELVRTFFCGLQLAK